MTPRLRCAQALLAAAIVGTFTLRYAEGVHIPSWLLLSLSAIISAELLIVRYAVIQR